METDNLSLQLDEIETLKAIFGDEFQLEPTQDCYSIQLEAEIKLFVTFCENYPKEGPPKFELLAPSLSLELKNKVFEGFQKIYDDNRGDSIVFQWIDFLKEVASERVVPKKTEYVKSLIESTPEEPCYIDISHGEVITDRKSAFQGHACPVYKEKDVEMALKSLKNNKKIAGATHNIMAFRVVLDNGVVLQDCQDDGEKGAGANLLHLLNVLKMTNVLVVVSRWFGGILLGPDRFKHINNAARKVLEENGFIK